MTELGTPQNFDQVPASLPSNCAPASPCTSFCQPQATSDFESSVNFSGDAGKSAVFGRSGQLLSAIMGGPCGGPANSEFSTRSRVDGELATEALGWTETAASSESMVQEKKRSVRCGSGPEFGPFPLPVPARR